MIFCGSYGHCLCRLRFEVHARDWSYTRGTHPHTWAQRSVPLGISGKIMQSGETLQLACKPIFLHDLQHTRDSFGSLLDCSGAVSNGAPSVQRHTAGEEWGFLNTLPHRWRAVGSGAPSVTCRAARKQWAVGCFSTAPHCWSIGQWDSFSTLSHWWGAAGNGLVLYTATLLR